MACEVGRMRVCGRAQHKQSELASPIGLVCCSTATMKRKAEKATANTESHASALVGRVPGMKGLVLEGFPTE